MKFPLNDWVAKKIMNSLLNHEGFTVYEHSQTDGTLVVQDVFGFRYKLNIEVEAIGRTAASYTETSGKDKELWMPE